MRRIRLRKSAHNFVPALTAAQAMIAHCDCIDRLLDSASMSLTAPTVDAVQSALRKIRLEAEEVAADCAERF